MYTYNLVDRIGNSVEEGSHIAYPVRKGSDMTLKVAKVKAIRLNDHGQGGKEVVADIITESGRRSVFRTFNRCVVLGSPVEEEAIYHEPIPC